MQQAHPQPALVQCCPSCTPRSYKPQKISPKFDGSVRQLLHKKIRESYLHPQVCTPQQPLPRQRDSSVTARLSLPASNAPLLQALLSSGTHRAVAQAAPSTRRLCPKRAPLLETLGLASAAAHVKRDGAQPVLPLSSANGQCCQLCRAQVGSAATFVGRK